MTEWAISEQAARLHADAMVCDFCYTWMEHGAEDLKLGSIPRMISSGYDFVSLTLAKRRADTG